jgi:cell division protein FtsB
MKKIAYLTTLIIGLLIINNLVQSIYTLWKKQDVVVGVEGQLQREKARQEKLQKELARVQKKDFIEEEARNNLFLVKPGEQVVLIPTRTQPTPSITPTPTPPVPNWEQWIDVFF